MGYGLHAYSVEVNRNYKQGIVQFGKGTESTEQPCSTGLFFEELSVKPPEQKQPDELWLTAPP